MISQTENHEETENCTIPFTASVKKELAHHQGTSSPLQREEVVNVQIVISLTDYGVEATHDTQLGIWPALTPCYFPIPMG